MNRDPIVIQALQLLECQVREADTMASPGAVKDYLRLKIADLPYEVFAVVFLTLSLWLTAFSVLVQGSLWAVVLVQTIRGGRTRS